jgi:hypothetical protein
MAIRTSDTNQGRHVLSHRLSPICVAEGPIKESPLGHTKIPGSLESRVGCDLARISATIHVRRAFHFSGRQIVDGSPAVIVAVYRQK